MLQPNQKTQNETGGDSQVGRIDKLENMLQHNLTQQAAQSNMLELGGMVSSINQRIPSSPPTVPPIPQAPSSNPERNVVNQQVIIKTSEFFSGDSEHCGGFLLQCKLAFKGSPQLYFSNFSKITYFLSQLKGNALQWANSFLLSHDLDTVP